MEAATYSFNGPGDICITSVVALEAQAQDVPLAGLMIPLFCALILTTNRKVHILNVEARYILRITPLRSL